MQQQEAPTVKWYQMDTNAPGSPTIRRVMRKMGLAGVGALFHLWCWTGERGKLEPGRAVDESGRPFDLEELIDASHLTEGDFEALIEICLESEHIDRDAWEQRKELNFTGMAKRADEYTRRIQGKGRDKVPSVSGEHREPVLSCTVPVLSCTVPVLVDLLGEAPSNVALFPAPPTAHQQADELMAYWNTHTSAPIPRCQLMTDKRVKQVALRLKEHGREKLREAIARIEASAFCRGETDRGQWVATMDWLLSASDVVVKVLEGKYDNRAAVVRLAPTVPGRVVAAGGKYAHVGVKTVGA